MYSVNETPLVYICIYTTYFLQLNHIFHETCSFVSLFQNIPTLGTVAVTMALHNCDEVAVAGFGYNMSTPDAPLHYYEKVKMLAIKEVTKDERPCLSSITESLLIFILGGGINEKLSDQSRHNKHVRRNGRSNNSHNI